MIYLMETMHTHLTKSDLQHIANGGYFDIAQPKRIRQFIETLCLQYKYPNVGKPFRLMVWQWKILKRLYGWKNADGSNRYTQLSMWIPKKNGKSTFIAFLCLCTALSRKGSLSLVIGSDLQESEIVFNEVACIAENHPELRKKLKRYANRTISNKETKSKIRMMSGCPTGKSGHQVSGLLVFDEIANWRSAFARRVADQLESSQRGMPNALKVIISTAQFDKTTYGYEQYKYAKDVIDGNIIDTTILPVIYEVPIEADWTNEDEWVKANPSVGTLFSLQDLRNDYQKVLNNPVEETRFRVLTLNQWTSFNGFIQSHVLAKCMKELNEDDFVNDECIISVDMARRFDLAVYTLLFKRDNHYYAFPRVFSPKDLAYRKALSDNVPYDRYAMQGYITLTNGDVIDNGYIRECIERDCRKFKGVRAIHFDAYGFEESRKILQDNLDVQLIEVPQTFATMAEPTAMLEKLIKGQEITIQKNPLTDWCFSNIVLRQDSYNRIMINKGKSRGRVDIPCSIIIGLTGYLGEQADTDNGMPFFF